MDVEQANRGADETVRLSAVDPTVARFPTTATVDLARDRSLPEAVGQAWAPQEEICRPLVKSAVDTGELAEVDLETAVHARQGRSSQA
jgi:hypothetical protein